MATKEEIVSQYNRDAHGMQSGVKMEMELTPTTSATDPKHLRVGVNSALADHGGLVALLIAKGVFTEEEYFQAIADSMRKERERYEELLSRILQTTVTLA